MQSSRFSPPAIPQKAFELCNTPFAGKVCLITAAHELRFPRKPYFTSPALIRWLLSAAASIRLHSDGPCNLSLPADQHQLKALLAESSDLPRTVQEVLLHQQFLNSPASPLPAPVAASVFSDGDGDKVVGPVPFGSAALPLSCAMLAFGACLALLPVGEAGILQGVLDATGPLGPFLKLAVAFAASAIPLGASSPALLPHKPSAFGPQPPSTVSYLLGCGLSSVLRHFELQAKSGGCCCHRNLHSALLSALKPSSARAGAVEYRILCWLAGATVSQDTAFCKSRCDCAKPCDKKGTVAALRQLAYRCTLRATDAYSCPFCTKHVSHERNGVQIVVSPLGARGASRLAQVAEPEPSFCNCKPRVQLLGQRTLKPGNLVFISVLPSAEGSASLKSMAATEAVSLPATFDLLPPPVEDTPSPPVATYHLAAVIYSNDVGHATVQMVRHVCPGTYAVLEYDYLADSVSGGLMSICQRCATLLKASEHLLHELLKRVEAPPGGAHTKLHMKPVATCYVNQGLWWSGGPATQLTGWKRSRATPIPVGPWKLQLPKCTETEADTASAVHTSASASGGLWQDGFGALGPCTRCDGGCTAVLGWFKPTGRIKTPGTYAVYTVEDILNALLPWDPKDRGKTLEALANDFEIYRKLPEKCRTFCVGQESIGNDNAMAALLPDGWLTDELMHAVVTLLNRATVPVVPRKKMFASAFLSQSVKNIMDKYPAGPRVHSTLSAKELGAILWQFITYFRPYGSSAHICDKCAETVCLPFHLPSHWIVVYIRPREGHYFYHDSLFHMYKSQASTFIDTLNWCWQGLGILDKLAEEALRRVGGISNGKATEGGEATEEFAAFRAQFERLANENHVRLLASRPRTKMPDTAGLSSPDFHPYVLQRLYERVLCGGHTSSEVRDLRPLPGPAGRDMHTPCSPQQNNFTDCGYHALLSVLHAAVDAEEKVRPDSWSDVDAQQMRHRFKGIISKEFAQTFGMLPGAGPADPSV